MKLSTRSYFLFFTFLGVIIYILQKIQISLPKIINNYLNDFLIVPIVLLLSLLLVRKLRNNKYYKFSVGVIAYVAIMYAFLFEYIIPIYNPRYTADIIDVLIYFLGGFTFWYIQKTERHD